MTDVNPSSIASVTRSRSSAWSRCTTTGTSAARDGQRRRGDGLEPAVPAGGVLADLQHDAGADLGGRGDERLGVLDLDDVERPDAAPLGAGRVEQVVGGDEGHQDSGSVTTWVSRRSTSARSAAPATGCRTAAAEVAAASARRCA